MNPFLLNLTFLYRSKSLLPVYAFVAIPMTLLLIARMHLKLPVDVMVMNITFLFYITSVMFTGLQMDLLAKPLVFGLPGHNRVLRNVFLAVGPFFAVLFTAFVLLLRLETDSPLLLPLILVNSFMFLWICGCWLALRLGFVEALGLFFFGLIGGGLRFGVAPFLFLTTPASLRLAPLTALGFWLIASILKNRDFIRRIAANPKRRHGLLAAWDYNRKQHQQATSTPAPEPRARRVENFFLSKISGSQNNPRAFLFWNTLYRHSGSFLINFAEGLWIILPYLALFTVPLGYMFDTNDAPIGPFVFPILLMQLGRNLPPSRSPLLLTFGRTQRFWSSVVHQALTVFHCAFWLTVVLLWIELLSGFMPDIHWGDRTLTYQDLEPMPFYAALTVLPLFAFGQLMLHDKGTIRLLFLIVSVSVFAALAPLLSDRDPLTPAALFKFILIPNLISWTLYLAALHHTCFRRDLVAGTESPAPS